NEADRSQNVSALLRNLPLQQTRADSIGRLLLRSIHTLNSARPHPTARRGSLKPGVTATPHSPKRRAPARLFPVFQRAECEPRELLALPTRQFSRVESGVRYS